MGMLIQDEDIMGGVVNNADRVIMSDGKSVEETVNTLKTSLNDLGNAELLLSDVTTEQSKSIDISKYHGFLLALTNGSGSHFMVTTFIPKSIATLKQWRAEYYDTSRHYANAIISNTSVTISSDSSLVKAYIYGLK